MLAAVSLAAVADCLMVFGFGMAAVIAACVLGWARSAPSVADQRQRAAEMQARVRRMGERFRGD